MLDGGIGEGELEVGELDSEQLEGHHGGVCEVK